MRAAVPFIVTVLMVSLLAPVAGLAVFGVLTGTPQLAMSHDLAGVPFLLYAARFALPVAMPAAIIVASLATCLSYAFCRQQHFWVWAVTFAALGLLLGIVCASPMIIACVREGALGLGRAWLFIGAACGAVLMTVLSGFWYLFFRTS